MAEAGDQGTGGEEAKRPATLADCKRIIRRKLRKREEEEEVGLNIYPMMDMMTILLVFMIMQFASGAAEIVQSEELRIPTSTSEVEAEQALAVVVSSSEIVVEGKQVLSLRNGKVDPSLKQGGGTGWLITPLFNHLKQHRDRLKVIASRNAQRPFRGEVRIIADRRTPFRTLGEVIYSLGQAEFGSLRFVVLKAGQPGVK
ncbi:MAG: biopolymer transporter ExbD [Myxococcales bacterium]|nr:biopolymer transporter ExbD [Myxococcales bacterium]